MTVNVWATVGVTSGYLPMEALLGSPLQLLGMNLAGTAAQWKEVQYDNTNDQLIVPASAIYTFTGYLDSGYYLVGANILGWKIGGTEKLRLSASELLASVNVRLSGKLVQEDIGADIAAAATTDLGTATGNYLTITNAAGATTITSLGGDTLAAGTEIETRISISGGSVTLTHNATSLILLGGANLSLVDGDIIRWRKINDASAYWRMVGFQRGVSSSQFTAKGDLLVGKDFSGTIQAAIKLVGADGQVLVGQSSQDDGLIWTDYSRDPLNVNPNMLLDQINEGALYTVGAAQQALDGWTLTGSGAGTFKTRRLVDPDNAARFVTEITCTGADAAIGATDHYSLYTSIEGYDLAQLAPGTASAGSITIQFQFKTNVTGVYGIAVQNSATNRRYIGTITVTDTNVHNYSVTLTLDTSGTWLYTDGVGCYVYFTLAAGANYQATAGAWAAGAERTTSAQCNFMSANTNIAYLGRFHIIPGNAVLTYALANFQRELTKAQRYYEKSYNQGTAIQSNSPVTAQQFYSTVNSGAVSLSFSVIYKVAKRAGGAFAEYNPITAAANSIRNLSTGADFGGAPLNGSTTTQLFQSNAGGAVANDIVGIHWIHNARLT